MKTHDEARTGAAQRAGQFRRASSDAEKRLWRALRSRLPQYKWRRQTPVGPCFADLASHTAKLIIELDGGQHAEATEYDQARTHFIETQGYRVLCFWNNDMPSNPDGVLERIGQSLAQGRAQLEAPQ